VGLFCFGDPTLKYSILVTGAPFDSQASYSAFQFSKALLESEHKLMRVFFYQAAVHNGTLLAAPPPDEFNVYRAWQELQSKYEFDCVVCIAAAARRGVINASEADRHEKAHWNLAPNFSLGGLGMLVDAHIHSDRLITFGV